jgi:predicted nucleotidyltransferase
MTCEEVAVVVIDALEKAQIRYMLVGSLTTSYYGVVRSTQDIDIMIDYTSNAIRDLQENLKGVAIIDPQMSFETITMSVRNEAQVIGLPFKIEFFHLSDDEFQQQRFSRKIRVDALGRKVYVPTVEDVIVMKARWARPKDVMDLEYVISIQEGNVDWPYVYSWADKHGTRELIDRIRSTVPKI